jgi:hypothetical protein
MNTPEYYRHVFSLNSEGQGGKKCVYMCVCEWERERGWACVNHCCLPIYIYKFSHWLNEFSSHFVRSYKPGKDNHTHQPTPWTGNTGHTSQQMVTYSCNWHYCELPTDSRSSVGHHMAPGIQMKSLAGDPAWLDSCTCKWAKTIIFLCRSKTLTENKVTYH